MEVEDLGLELDRPARSCMSVTVRWVIRRDHISLVGRLGFPSRCVYDGSFLTPLCLLYI